MTTQKITAFLMCPATHASALGGTPAANDADGRHIRKVAGWVHVFDALMSAAQLVPTEDGNHAGNGEPKALIALGATSEERCGDGDCQGEGTDSSTNEQQQREEIRFVAHVVLLLGSFEIEAKHALVAARLGLERSIGQPLDLELAFVRRVIAPSAYTALVNAERSSDGGLGAVVADNIRGLHGT